MLAPPMRSDPDATIRQHAVLIVNPAAGCGRSVRAAAHLENALRGAGIVFTRHDTRAPGHARELAANATGLVVVVGGDGTVHEVVDGLPARDGTLGPLAVLPCGSGDDFAGGVGFTRDAATLASRLRTRTTRAIDVGLAELEGPGGVVRQRFVNAGALGLDAEVAARARRFRWLRGRALYTFATLAVLRRPPRFVATVTHELDDGSAPVTATRELAFASTCNGPRVGGGLVLAPEARCDDQRLHVVEVAGCRASTLLWLLGKLLIGRHRGDTRVRTTACVRFQLRSSIAIAAALDGEPLPQRVHAATFSVLPERLLLMGLREK
jgi:diacylglycerol kinase (ATP)